MYAPQLHRIDVWLLHTQTRADIIQFATARNRRRRRRRGDIIVILKK